LERTTIYLNILSEEAVRQGINVEWGKKLESIEVTNQHGVVATFQDGTTASGDLLIGCDGVHSRTRRIIDPAPPPHPALSIPA